MKKKPIIADSFIISITNSLISFISGFAVWSIVGYLAETSEREVANISFSLVFVTYPEAIDTIKAPNFWGIILSLTLFLLGLDSAFAMVEAVSTVIYDGMKTPPHRAVITLGLCVMGFLISLLFCTNWGLILFDVFDHYLSNYLLFIVGILQCLGVGWLFDIDRTMAISENHHKSVMISTYGYWFFLFICGVAGIADYNAMYGLLAFITIEAVLVLPWSFIVCDSTFEDWWTNVCMCGVKRIGYSMSKLARLE
jgi:SNF family Na+-dependent transporter